MRDYSAIALQYAHDVVDGKIPACRWARLACRRQLKNLAEGVPGYHFDPVFAGRPCLFIEHLRHVKGALAGRRIVLEPWQVFVLTTAFGWVDAAGKRRFRHVYIEVPRGNGKSALSSGVALYMLAGDGESGAECYTFATTRDQAKIVFNVAQQMARLSPDVMRTFGISVQAKTVTVMKKGSLLEPKSAEGSTMDGLNTHLAVIDELHAHKTRDLYDVVETSLGKRLQPLLWVITTAGFDTSSICYEVRSMVTMVLEGTAVDESQFGIIYSLDEGDDWTTVDALRKANPNWEVSVMPAEVLKLQQKAMLLPSSANNFKTKHLDLWCSARAAWMNMEAWKADEGSFTLDDFAGERCVIGLDLAAKNDICAAVLVFPRENDDGKTVYFVVPRLYLPRRAVERTADDEGRKSSTANAQYSGWVSDGWITEAGDAMIELSEIEDDIREWLSTFDVKAIAYDPWNAVQLAGNLSSEGAPMVELRNSVQNLSEPMKWLDGLVNGGLLNHDGNPAMTWMMGNVVAKADAKDNIFPRKDRPELKIDGPVALIFAMATLLSDREEDEGDFSDFADNMIVV